LRELGDRAPDFRYTLWSGKVNNACKIDYHGEMYGGSY
jgi:hypothetical protein